MRNSIVTTSITFCIFALMLVTYIFSLLSKVDSSYFFVLLPLVLMGMSLLYISYMIGKFNHDLQGKKGRYYGGPVFWILICDFSLPVISAQLSSILKIVGFEGAGNYLFENRFTLMLWSTIILIVLFFLTIPLVYFYQKFRDRLNLRIVENGLC